MATRTLPTIPSILGCAIFLMACGPIPDPLAYDTLDVRPPQVVSVKPQSPSTIVITFSEPATLVSNTLRIYPELEVRGVTREDMTVIVAVETPLSPGGAYVLEATAQDVAHNTVHFLIPFYGLNPDIPSALINELIMRGSGNHPDAVEIAILSNGNTAGMCIYQGTDSNWKDRIVLPSIDVKTNEFIIVHWKPTDSTSEVDETVSMAISGGSDASDSAWDLWVHGATGLSGNNGVICLYNSPGGDILDGLLYSNRTSGSDESYLGFGSRDVMERAIELQRSGAWVAQGEEIAPEDAVSPEGSTGTRSLCRDSASTDTDNSADWHIVPTRGATLGAVNSDEVYAP